MKIILALLLMTGVCFANEEYGCNWGVWNTSTKQCEDEQKTLSNTHMIVDATTDGYLKLSCQDGYIFLANFKDRKKYRNCKNIEAQSSTWILCNDKPVTTDAELKCVKE